MLFDIENPPHDFAKPFDIWSFGGNSKWSFLIKLFSCSFKQWLDDEAPSHLAITSLYEGSVSKYNGQLLLFESTELVDMPCCITGRRHSGVQAHPILDRIKAYDGKVWRYRLNPYLLVDDNATKTANSFLLSKLGSPYNMRDAVLSCTEYLRSARWLSRNENAEFCSDLVLETLKLCDIVDRTFNSKSYNPARAVRDVVYWQVYQAIYCGSESGRVK